jgi:alkanesulfonate monooxygenase SsuD/methylene tetrahydromethanopterin reductase-like flavin-dependent oxidoreductase (luciferase family)
MRLSNFLFPECRDPADEERVLDEVLAEAKLSDRLGVDVLWLAEHHFDGNCVYVDPVSFAAALATCTQRITIGFAVAQMSLHHPIRMAEQLSLIDHLSKGRLIVGLGRGTGHNIYDYQGFGIDHAEAQNRFEEAEAIMFKAWTSEAFEHHGRFWDLKVPMLRPRPYTKPHPPVIRGASGEDSLMDIARAGRPFLMNVQSDEITRHRVERYRATMREAGFSEARIAENLRQSWVWRNVVVAPTDAGAERVGLPAFEAMQEQRAAMREKVRLEQGVTISHAGPVARTDHRHALIAGSPATVAEKLSTIEALGVGGVIASIRLGPMPYEAAAQSLTLLMEQVAPALRTRAAA